MGKPKFDGVVEAAHYEGDGKLIWVRAFERRGSAFSDWVLIPRQELINRLKAGKKYYAGKRIEFKAGTFDISTPLKLVQQSGTEYITTGEPKQGMDNLENIPVV